MSRILPENLNPEISDRSVAADVLLLRQEPDEEEEEEEDEGDGKEKEDDNDDDTDDSYSEWVCSWLLQWVKDEARRFRQSR
jgi:hypothetical protein